MDAQAIALPRGAALLWVRVGEVLDAIFAYRPDEVVQRIVEIASGFRVDTRDLATGTIRCYEAPCFFVSQVEPLFEHSVPQLDDALGAESTEESLILRAYRAYGV